MGLGQRIDDRRKELGISQAELARRVGIRQSTLHSLINGDSRTSRSIMQIARELRTSVAYLMGDTDDPDADAPPPAEPPRLQLVAMQVALPSERALARMFEGLLMPLNLSQSKDELARTLARWLPIGLSQLQGLLPMVEPDASVLDQPAVQLLSPQKSAAGKELVEADATHRRVPRRGPRT